MGLLLSPRANFSLAWDFQQKGAPVGDLFQFASGLYFRGKLAYARAFGRAPLGGFGALAIVPGRGLMNVDEMITVDQLKAMAQVPVDLDDERYRMPLERDARVLARLLGKSGEAVLLGSIATGKYVDIIESHFDGRLRFPCDFVGRGDMSRGGLMLRCVLHRKELEYIPIAGATRHGKKPPRLRPLR